MSRITSRIVSLALLGGLAISASSCGGALGGLGGGGGLSGDCTGGDFGADAAAQKLEAFLSATDNFVGTAAELEAQLLGTCRDMGTTLGLTDADMAVQGDEAEVQAACNAVAEQIRAELQDLRVNASLTINIVATPPVCEVTVDAYAGCMAECEVDYQPGQVDMQCEGGELRGTCSAECTGSCAAEVSGQCSGACEGSCSGGCSGTCQGTCDGTCSATGADGQCNGTCDGTCRGSCSAGCSGSCEGSCVVEAQASCQGECRGGCSVDFQEPRCTGRVVPPSASAECQATCDAGLSAEASCRPGSVYVEIVGSIDDEGRIARLRNAIESGLGSVIAVGEQLGRLLEAGRTLADTMADLPDAVASLGLQAGACATAALGALPQATVQVSVSVEVSASVSGSASAG